MKSQTNFRNILKKKWDISRAEKYSSAISSFSLSQRVFFYFLFGVFCLSAFYLFFGVNSAFLSEVPVAGGTFQEGVIGYPRYINPVLAITDPGRDLTALVYAGLMRGTSGGEVVVDLAKNYNISDDGLTYTFTLKDNLTFQDGTPLTTDDVEFTIQKIQDPALNSPKGANWQGVTVEKINAREIKFHLKKPYGPFLQNTTIGILPKHLWDQATDADSFTLSDLNRQPIGAGPYMIKNIQTTGAGLPQNYHLVPFNNYAGGPPYIKNIIIRFYSNEEALVGAYSRNEIQAVNAISPGETQYLKSRNTDIKTITLPRVFGIFFNQNEDQVLIHPEIRQALNEAVDRQRIVDEVLFGFGTPATEPIPSNLLDGGSTSTPEETAAMRIAKAKDILTKAGWAPGSDGLMQKKTSKTSTETLKLTLATADNPDLIATANLVKKMWQAIGASVEVKIFEASDLNQNVIRPRKYDALLFGEIIPSGLDIYGFWHSSERLDPGLNIALYTNSKADKLLEGARSTSDRSIALDNYRKFEKEVDNDVPAVFLYSPDFIYAVPKNLGGMDLGNIIVPSDRFNGISKWYLETEKVWKIFTR